MIRSSCGKGPALEPMRQHYGACKSFMNRTSFYNGILEPEDDLIADIGEKLDYIRDAEALVGR